LGEHHRARSGRGTVTSVGFVYAGIIAAFLASHDHASARVGTILALLAAILGVVQSVLPERGRHARARRGLTVVFAIAGFAIALPGLPELGDFLTALLAAPMAFLYTGWMFTPLTARIANGAMLAMLSLGAAFNETWQVELVASGALAVLGATSLVITAEVSLALASRLREVRDVDPLTGALTRRGISRAAPGLRRGSQKLWLLLADMNGLKRINDRDGHAAGDDALRSNVTAWRRVLDGHGQVGRWGGDEFVMAFRAANDEAACAVAAKLREASPHAFASGLREWDRRSSLEQVVAAADKELYADKAGRLPRRSPVELAEQDVRRARTAHPSRRFRQIWLAAAAAYLLSGGLAYAETGAPLSGTLSLLAALLSITVALLARRPGSPFPGWIAIVWTTANIVLTIVRLTQDSDASVVVQSLFGLPLAASIVSGSASPLVARLSIAALAACVVTLQSSPERLEVVGAHTLAASVATSWIILETVIFARRHLRRMADVDELTGTLNRRGLAEATVALVKRADRQHRTVTVAAIDFDDFKGINDTFGHARGDRLLIDTARGWRAALGRSAVVSRIGGDEFVIVFRRASLSEARRLLAQLRAQALSGWSVGLAERAPGEPLEDALVRADRQLYQAKAGG